MTMEAGSEIPQLWGISDGSAGMVAQLRGLLDAIALPYAIKRVERERPFVWLPNFMCGNVFNQMTDDSAPLTPPWPKMVVTCGRRSAPFGLAIRKKSNGFTKAVHIGDPQGRKDDYDLIIAMQHDRLYGQNVIDIRCSLHNITVALLSEVRHELYPHFAGRQKPFVALLIGGSTNKYRFGSAAETVVMETIQRLLEHTAATLLVTASRRTGEKFEQHLKRHYAGFKRVWIADRHSFNPYLGFLAYADHIVVTNDSVNMMSEALATGNPVYILPLPGHEGTKPERFAYYLVEDGIARFFDLPLEEWTYPDLAEAGRVAALVKDRLGL